MFQRRRRTKASVAKGLRYEKLVGQLLQDTYGKGNVIAGPWISYVESCGKTGLAQPDFLVTLPDGVLIVEAKLTQCLLGDSQLFHLYMPLVSFLYPGKPIWLLQIFSNIVMPDRPEVTKLAAISQMPQKFVLDFHWVPPLGARVKRQTAKGRGR